MLVAPTKGHLQHSVQVSNGAVTPHEQAPPDQRADAAEHNSKLVHHGLGVRGGFRHRAIIAPAATSPVAPPSPTFAHSPSWRPSCSCRSAKTLTGTSAMWLRRAVAVQRVSFASAMNVW